MAQAQAQSGYAADPAGAAGTAVPAGLGPIVHGGQVLRTLIGLSAGINVLLLAGSLFMLMVYDTVLPAGSLPSLAGLVGLLLIAAAFQGGFEHVRHRLAGAVGAAVDAALAGPAFAAMLAAPGTADGTRPARDLAEVRAFLHGPAPLALLDLPWSALFLLVLFGFHWVLGLACLGGAALLCGLAGLTERTSRAALTAAADGGADRYALLEGCRRNAETVRALGMAPAMQTLWLAAGDRHARLDRAAGHRLSVLHTFSRSFRLLLQSLILAVGAWLVIAGEASGGIIVAGSVLAARALAPLDAAIGNWRAIVQARAAWLRLGALMPGTSAAVRSPAVPASGRTALAPPRQALVLDALICTAPGRAAPLLDRVSVRLAAGEALGVVGASGSGKSTLARALVGLVAPAGGSIRLDGATLDQWDSGAAGRFIGYVPQDIELFAGTAAQNIARFDPTIGSAAIIAAAREAGVHELIVGLPGGYDTPVGPGTPALSAGQRQRIALARALLRDPFLIVLDEPNANLDAAGDLALSRAIGRARQRGAIVVIVAHRPSALAAVDRVLWLDQGRVRALGQRDVVLARLGGAVSAPRGPRVSAAPSPASPFRPAALPHGSHA